MIPVVVSKSVFDIRPFSKKSVTVGLMVNKIISVIKVMLKNQETQNMKKYSYNSNYKAINKKIKWLSNITQYFKSQNHWAQVFNKTKKLNYTYKIWLMREDGKHTKYD